MKKEMEKKTEKMNECLNCGHSQTEKEKDVHVDELGKYTICKECNSSFDID